MRYTTATEVYCTSSGSRDCSHQPTTYTFHRRCTSRLRPSIVDREVVPRQRDRRHPAPPNAKKDVRTPAEHDRGLSRARREVQVKLRDLRTRRRQHRLDRTRHGAGRTSPAVTLPVFSTVNETSNTGRCSHGAVELPSAEGPTRPCLLPILLRARRR